LAYADIDFSHRGCVILILEYLLELRGRGLEGFSVSVSLVWTAGLDLENSLWPLRLFEVLMQLVRTRHSIGGVELEMMRGIYYFLRNCSLRVAESRE
jgi:hypothetical protein